MAADQYVVGSGPIILPAAQLGTLAINTAATRRITINAVRLSFSAAATVNVVCQLARISNTPVGTAIPAGYGPNPHDVAAPAALTSALTATPANPGAWTTAPTKGAILWEMVLPSSGGWAEWPVPGEEWDQPISAWLGVYCTAAATGVTAYSQLVITE